MITFIYIQSVLSKPLQRGGFIHTYCISTPRPPLCCSLHIIHSETNTSNQKYREKEDIPTQDPAEKGVDDT